MTTTAVAKDTMKMHHGCGLNARGYHELTLCGTLATENPHDCTQDDRFVTCEDCKEILRRRACQDRKLRRRQMSRR